MKKIIALLLTCMMMVCVACAEEAVKTEETPEIYKTRIEFDKGLSFDVLCPETYSMDQEVVNGTMVITLAPLDGGNGACATLLVAPDERYVDFERLNDMSEEEVKAFADDFCYGSVFSPVIVEKETGLGSKLLIITDAEAGESNNFAYLVSVYHGYMIVMYMDHPDGSVVTEEEIDAMIYFNTNMDFVFAE